MIGKQQVDCIAGGSHVMSEPNSELRHGDSIGSGGSDLGLSHTSPCHGGSSQVVYLPTRVKGLVICRIGTVVGI